MKAICWRGSTTATIASRSTPPRRKIATQDATIARIGRQIEAQGAVIAQAERAGRLRRGAEQSAEADATRAALEFDRAQKLADDQFRLAAAPRAGRRRPRPHRRRAERRQAPSLPPKRRSPAPRPISTC